MLAGRLPLANAVVGLVDAVLCASLAIFVFAIAPERRANRALTWLLVVEGAAQLLAAIGNLSPPLAAVDGIAAGATLGFALAILPTLYLLVLRELDTPFGAALRSRAGVAVLAVATLAYAGWTIGDGARASGQLGLVNQAVLLVVMLLALVVGAWAVVRAPRGSARRRQAVWFVIAFGARDVLFILYFAGELATGAGAGGAMAITFPRSLLGIPLPFLGTLLFVPLLAYAILARQLFDIDVRIKRGLRRGLVAGAFVAVFFAASETTERALAAQWGPVAGLAAAVLLAFAFRPLERAAGRVADIAMPRVSEGDDLAARRLDAYRAAIESAHESGGISEKERASLARLREKLGVPADAAARLESEVIAGALA